MKKGLKKFGWIGFLFLPLAAMAVEEVVYKVDRTSFTNQAGVNLRIVGAGPGDVFQGIFVGQCGSPGSSVTVYDSSGTGTYPLLPSTNVLFYLDTSSSPANIQPTAVPSCNAIGTHWMSIDISSSITYTIFGSSSPDVTFLWYNKNRNPNQN